MVFKKEIKVLFVSSSTRGAISNLTLGQGESLRRKNVDVQYYKILKGGIWGYLKSIKPLRNEIKQGQFDIIHAHYVFSGIIAAISTRTPIIVSLMGSDVEKTIFYRWVIRVFNYLFWRKIIVKSNSLKKRLNISSIEVIPNGVDLSKFKLISKDIALQKVDFSPLIRNILFLADPMRKEKNYALAKKSVELLNRNDIKLSCIYNEDPTKIPYFINAADVLLLTSFWEGSPNVIKEAMATGLPIVSCDVGDVKESLDGLDGCYVTSYSPHEIANSLSAALGWVGKTKGRQKIIELKIDSDSIADKIIFLYNQVLAGN